jgi:hypothetical protein
MMISKPKVFTVAALALIGATATPAALSAQTYICTTTTTSSTYYSTLSDGTKLTTTIIVISRACVPQES